MMLSDFTPTHNYCTNCGTKNKQYKYCPNCGTSFKSYGIIPMIPSPIWQQYNHSIPNIVKYTSSN